MKTTLEKVRNLIAASMAGWLPEEYEQQQREEKLKGAVDRFLENHPEYIERYTSKPTTAPAVAPVANTKQKAKRIMKTLGAGAGVFTPPVVDEAALARARSKCREIVAADPAAYSYVIPSEPLPDQDKPGGAGIIQG
ncbi:MULTISPECIES: hypothetical protein [Enterobacteriaceae]|uniref:hypothetical protein n=1 Tax=Enterobacteriaceae TaxID=543 RepID=UPI000948EB84|nr:MULTISPECIES: hypothetical protein [Enterobacteriaceae]HCR0228763.1 hypothetical protein [Enterobacter kobei]HCT9377336.1 hypothetical protein [Klebsiella quasipneumoniae]PUX40229.1 hypothetical protein BS409_00050 [Cronobacter sakazakii]PUX54947.1 hypothetical protein BS418_05890 [Cronobacter sakazakii]PUX61626.1 hypothetical protein BS417_03190 [Cronobacter sakazakii]